MIDRLAAWWRTRGARSRQRSLRNSGGTGDRLHRCPLGAMLGFLFEDQAHDPLPHLG